MTFILFLFQAHFFCAIRKNGYKVLYLSARAIGQVRLVFSFVKQSHTDSALFNVQVKFRLAPKVKLISLSVLDFWLRAKQLGTNRFGG